MSRITAPSRAKVRPDRRPDDAAGRDSGRAGPAAVRASGRAESTDNDWFPRRSMCSLRLRHRMPAGFHIAGMTFDRAGWLDGPGWTGPSGLLPAPPPPGVLRPL